jgi:hypothetical protein
LPIFIKEQPYVVVLQGLLIEGGGISVVLHLEVGREGGVGHSAVKRLPNWAESRGKYATANVQMLTTEKGGKISALCFKHLSYLRAIRKSYKLFIAQHVLLGNIWFPEQSSSQRVAANSLNKKWKYQLLYSLIIHKIK